MKRFHVHVAVPSIPDAVRFYSKVFGAPPTVEKSDYAKWMVEEPRLNFAISARGAAVGVNHLEFQLDSDEELQAMHAQLAAADASLVEEIGAHCCYAKSDKYWVTDPAGVAWETYHTLGSIPVFGDEAPSTAEATGCCAPEAAEETEVSGCCSPAATTVSARIPVKARTACC